jgi:hypothetical protein
MPLHPMTDHMFGLYDCLNVRLSCFGYGLTDPAVCRLETVRPSRRGSPCQEGTAMVAQPLRPHKKNQSWH